LEQRFCCPVLDLYSLNEAGPIAVADDRCGGHVLLQHCMYVEILDEAGKPVPPGERGEVTLTGGFNFCLPLLRYRTGDFASLTCSKGEAVLVGLEGRPPVRFRTLRGEMINNIEVTHSLRRFAIPRFALHQDGDGHLTLRLAAGAYDPEEVRQAIQDLFGAAQPLSMEALDLTGEKIVQYTSVLENAGA
jgi:phenylacetate-CoA ligase